MNSRSQKRLALAFVVCFIPFAVFAATLVTSSVDGGGQRATSASYTMDGSMGGIAGISTVASPPETVKAGYIGQLTEVASLTVTGAPTSVNEGATSQLSGMATLDDATVVALAGADVNWSSPGVPYPLSGINASGLATAALVYQNTPATVNGYYLGMTSNTTVQVLDSNPDNYGIYAADNIPDWWQVQYFGLNNPNGVGSADADGTGQNNLFKYVAGLDPTNAASVFKLRIENVVGQPNQKKLTFLPWASARTYTPEFRTDLTVGAYATLAGYSGPTTNATEVSISDQNATQASKFYRIRITYP
jgi:hypothetical protein